MKNAVINTTTIGANTIVAAVVGKKIRLLNYVIAVAAQVAVTWKSDATALSGPIILVLGSPLVASAGESMPVGMVPLMATATGEALVLDLAAGVQVSGHITYYEFA